MNDREGAEWLIRLAQAVEESGNNITLSDLLRVGCDVNGLEFLERLAEEGIVVANEGTKKPKKKRLKGEDDDWDEDDEVHPKKRPKDEDEEDVDYHKLDDTSLLEYAEGQQGAGHYRPAGDEIKRRAKAIGMSQKEIEEYATWREVMQEMQRRAKSPKKEPSPLFVIEAYKGRGKVYFTHQGGWTKDMGEARLYRDRDQAVRHASTNKPPNGYKDRVIETDPRFFKEGDDD